MFDRATRKAKSPPKRPLPNSGSRRGPQRGVRAQPKKPQKSNVSVSEKPRDRPGVRISPQMARQQAKKRLSAKARERMPEALRPRDPVARGPIATSRQPRKLQNAQMLRFEDATHNVELPESFDEIVFELLGNVGFSSSILVEMLWLLRIHKNACLIPSPFAQSGRNRFDVISVDWVCAQDKSLAQFSFAFKTKDKVPTRSKDRVLKVPKNFQQTFMRCVNNPNIRFVVIPAKFVYVSCGPDTLSRTPDAHANMILYDKKTKTMERFEPWGFLDQYDTDEFDREFSNWILNAPENSELPINYYLGATEICPREGHQFLQEMDPSAGELPGGEKAQFFNLLAESDEFLQKVTDAGAARPNLIMNFCSIWSNWYANLRMTNPGIAPARVIEESINLLKNDPRGMSVFILRYATFVRSEALKIFKDIGVDVDVRANFLDQFDRREDVDRIIARIEDELEKRISNV